MAAASSKMTACLLDTAMKRYTDEQITEAVKNSNCVMEAMRYLGIRETGGSHGHLKRRIAKMNLDTSHFKKSQHFLKPGVNRVKAEDILVLRASGTRQKAHRLRRALVESGRKYECVDCGNQGEWAGKPLTLEVDHKDGNWLDDRAENLEFLCPNCHSLKTANVA